MKVSFTERKVLYFQVRIVYFKGIIKFESNWKVLYKSESFIYLNWKFNFTKSGDVTFYALFHCML